MKRRRWVWTAAAIAVGLLAVARAGEAGEDIRKPLASPLKVRQGMLNVPALSPLYLLPEEAKKYNIQIEQIMFQRFADARTALASGDLELAAFGPQDIGLAVAGGAKSLVGVAGLGAGNDCLIARKGVSIASWKDLEGKTIGVGAGSISWLKFVASVEENGLDYRQLKIVNVMGGGANYQKALQKGELDMAVVWQPFCAQGIVEGYAQYPGIDHNKSKAIGGWIAVLAVNRGFMEKNRDAVLRLVLAYTDILKFARENPDRWAQVYAEKAGLPLPVAKESIRITNLDHRIPLASITRMGKFLADRGIVQKDVSGEIAQHYNFEFLSQVTGQSAAELGQGL